MTIGQRIAYKRKELGLSQEALGEQLNVSRQSIYKWESDAALPEIDKLVVLSKLFGVSVGWLLGVEEEDQAADPQESVPEPTDELSDAQLKMVKEIVEQYLASQPKPKPRRKWPWVLLGFAVLISGFSIINRLDQIEQQYQRVQMTVSNVQDSVNSQIGGISSRVEEILKSQNNLTAEYGTEIKSADLKANTITFSVYATPKTYVEGMSAQFSADSGHEPSLLIAETAANQKFSAEITCALTNDIVLSVAFSYPDGTRQTQVLDTYDYLYSGSMPSANVLAHDLMFADAPGGHLKLPAHYATVALDSVYKELSDEPVTITDVQAGLFVNKKLLVWGEPAVDTSPDRVVLEDSLLFKFPELDLQLDADTELYVAAIITDQFGRKTIGHDVVYILDSDGSGLTHPSYSEMDSTLDNWTFE